MSTTADQANDSELAAFEKSVNHTDVRNGEVNIHCASIGEGPLVVLMHGFPDHWLGWWKVMQHLSKSYKVVAIDLRGYNLSDKPEQVEDYKISHLVSDVECVIKHFDFEKAVIIGHDWGGFVAWHVAMDAPDLVDRLVVLNMPHPWAISRELSNNPAQNKASEYVRLFKHPLAHTQIPDQKLNFWVKDAELLTRHDLAMRLSSKNGMLNYYRANWPQEPYSAKAEPPPLVKARTLLIHGLKDIYALPSGLNDVWEWVDAPLTIETFPECGHFVQHESPLRVAQCIQRWLQ